LCPLSFFKHDVETLTRRIGALTLNWITFENLLGLPNLVKHHIPGKFPTTRKTSKQVFGEMKRQDLFVELKKEFER
jgi:hypothetical protein